MLSSALKIAGSFFQWILKRNSPEERLRRKKDAIRKKHQKEVAAIEAAISSEGSDDINRVTADIIGKHDDTSGGLPGEN
jgi:hypothetical protein